MGQGNITACRGCKSKKLKPALTINKKRYVICQICTLLQLQENIPYELTFDLSKGIIIVDYFPYFLTIKKFPKDDRVFYFSLKSIEAILEQSGFVVTEAVTTNDGQLQVRFEKMTTLDRIRMFEMVKRLVSQYTYFLYSVKKK